MQDELRIRTVLFREGDWWVAQCLDVDIAAQAKTENDLEYELGRILVGHVMASETLGVKPFANLPPAPRRYWDMFFGAASKSTTMIPFLPVTVSHALPKVEMRAA
ncbi:MAG TPA: hypothetical protein VH988_35555 [Thermoanaerobaculia bacterium]|jgi:hypothetical protein|nr:hypothetical protein [Thermoanaerobaculia bacterium]